MAGQMIYLQRIPTCLNTQKRKLEKTRKYSNNYLKFGFTYKETDGDELPVCVVCSSVLSNETMKPSKLQRQLQTHHDAVTYFVIHISCLKSCEGQQTLMRQSAKVCKLALKASYQVALRVAQTKKPYIIAESLILPAASDMCKTMFGKEEYVKKTEKHPFARPIDELAADVSAQLVTKLQKADYFALQIDESTDVSNDAQLLAFVWFVDQNEMQEEFLFCKQLPGQRPSSEIFKVINNFFREHHTPLPKCVAMCTDAS